MIDPGERMFWINLWWRALRWMIAAAIVLFFVSPVLLGLYDAANPLPAADTLLPGQNHRTHRLLVGGSSSARITNGSGVEIRTRSYIVLPDSFETMSIYSVQTVVIGDGPPKTDLQVSRSLVLFLAAWFASACLSGGLAFVLVRRHLVNRRRPRDS